MRYAFSAALLVGLALTAYAQADLTEAQQLKVEAQLLKERLVQVEYQLATCEAQQRARMLTSSRSAIEREVVPEGYALDWQTGKLVKK